MNHKCRYMVRSKSGDYYKHPYTEYCEEPSVVFYGVTGVNQKIISCISYCLDHKMDDVSDRASINLIEITEEEYSSYAVIKS